MSTLPAAVLFDLDGTVVDSADSILGALRDAFAEIGAVVPAAATDRALLGPPLAKSLPGLVGADVTEAVLPVYRRIYAQGGAARTRLYPGVGELVHELVSAGVTVAVATSKSQVNATLITDHHGLTEVFATVCGDTPESLRPTKAHVIAEVLDRIGHPESVVMVGDRALDVVGARTHGIDCLGAGWGYGTAGELEEAGATVVCGDAGELAAALGVRG